MMKIREKRVWQFKNRSLELGGQTAVMGILNATPDSFSDGGDFLEINDAVERALKMEAEGAVIIDIGGESTRPNSLPVSEAEELRRVVPIIGKIREASDVLISVDTTKAVVAREALLAGADIVNDVSAFEADDKMMDVVAESGAGAVLMHKKGIPKTMQQNPTYENVVEEVATYLRQRVAACEVSGIGKNNRRNGGA